MSLQVHIGWYPSPTCNRWVLCILSYQTMAETVSHPRLAAGSGTTLVELVRPALGWRCRCSLFHSRKARNGTSFGVEQCET